MNVWLAMAAATCGTGPASTVVYPERMTPQHRQHQHSAPFQFSSPGSLKSQHQSSTTSNFTPPAWNMSGLVGAEYTPWRVGNQLWWHNFTDYADDVAREVKAMKAVFGFTAIRVFLHDILHSGTISARFSILIYFVFLKRSTQCNGTRIHVVF